MKFQMGTLMRLALLVAVIWATPMSSFAQFPATPAAPATVAVAASGH